MPEKDKNDSKIKQRRRENYRKDVLLHKTNYMDNIRMLQGYYGSKGHYGPQLHLSEEYNALTFDVPEGLDENTVTAIVLGSIMKKERMDHQMTTSSAAGILNSITGFNQNFLIDNLAKEKPDYPRQGSFALAMVEGRKDAIQAIEEYKKGNLEPAKAMIRTFLDFAMDSVMLSEGARSSRLYTGSMTNMQVAVQHLGTELIDKPPFNVTIEGSEIQDIKGRANEQVMQNVSWIYEEKPNILTKPKAPGSAERIREIEDLMFREYLMSTQNIAIDETHDAGKKYTDQLKQDYGFDFEEDPRKARQYRDAVSNYEFRLAWNFRDYQVTDHEVLLSSQEGIEKLRELYMPEIRKTELYRKMISAEGTEYEDLFSQLDETAAKGLQSFKNVKVPPAAKEINARNRKLLEEKNREQEAEIDRAVLRFTWEEMNLSNYTNKTLQQNAAMMELLDDLMDKDNLKDKELSAGMRKSLGTLRTSVNSFLRLADNLAEKKTAVTEEELRQYEEYGKYVGKKCAEYLSKHTSEAKSEAEKDAIRSIRRVRNIVRACPERILELYQKKRREDQREAARGMRDHAKAQKFAETHKNVNPEDPEFFYGTLSENGLNQLSAAIREEMAAGKAGKSKEHKIMIDRASTAVKALTGMIIRGEEYVAQHQEEAADYLRDIMAERIMKSATDLRLPRLEPDRYFRNVVDKVPEMSATLENITIGTIGKIAFDGHADTLLIPYLEEIKSSDNSKGKLRTLIDEVTLEKHKEEMDEIEEREKPAAARKKVNPGKKGDKDNKNIINDPEEDNKNEINLEEEVIPKKEEIQIQINLENKNKKKIIHDPEEDNKNEINLEEPEEENLNVIMPEKADHKDSEKRRLRKDPPLAGMKKKAPKAPVRKAEDLKEDPKAVKEDPKAEQPGRIQILNDEIIELPVPVPFEELRNDPKNEEEHPAMQEDQQSEIEEEHPAMQEDQQSEIGEHLGMMENQSLEVGEEHSAMIGADEEELSIDDSSIDSNSSMILGIPDDDLIVNPISALDYIEDIRDHKFEEINIYRITNEMKADYGDQFLRIMAARQLAGSERRDPSRLESYILSAEQVEERVALMKNDEIFRGFIDDIMSDNDKMITAINGAMMCPGHGGKLDDMMKEYMLNLPPGELKNSKLHERYMPKVDARIESIQNQVKRLNKLRPANDMEDERKDHQLSCAVAEILELRNLAKAETGRKESLAKTIPCYRNDTLKQKIDHYADRESFRMSALHRDVQRLVLKGHGGQMTLKARELDSERDTQNLYPCEIITANSIGTRMKKLERKARALARDLRQAEAGSMDQQQISQKGKNLLEEYSLLFAKVVDPETYVVENAKLRQDVPWSKIGDLRTKETTFTRNFRHTFGYFNPGDIADSLDIMARSDSNHFKDNMNTKINQVSARINTGHNQANPQANQQANRQRNRNKGGRKK